MTKSYNKIPPEVLNFVVYSEDSPSKLRWKNALYSSSKKHPGVVLCRRKAGSVAGGFNTQGYYTVPILGKYYLVHRIIYTMFHGDISDSEIDHLDGNRSNNSISNLRIVDRVGNSRNRSKSTRNNPNIPTGIHWETSEELWVARYVSPTEKSINGKMKRKKLRFSPNDFIDQPDPVQAALDAALIWRMEKIREVNIVLLEQGKTPYTTRHGSN